MWITSSPATALTPTTVALGNFDGIHLGHEQVIKPILRESRGSIALEGQKRLSQLEASSFQETLLTPKGTESDRIYATMATFYPHPREFFSGEALKLLTPRAEKVQQLSVLGVEQLVLLPFDRELASLSPEQFVEKILVQELKATRVSVGVDFRFGNQRAGNSSELKAIASGFGIDVTIVPLFMDRGERVSSSLIRESLQEGDIDKANRLLGRAYSLTGVVVQGQQLGRKIGFPTANLQLPPDKFLPRHGVYCVRVTTPSLPSLLSEHLGVMNIGIRPTVNGTSLTVEVHVLDWSGDLYGQTLTVKIEKFLRGETKFPSLDALKSQIQGDCTAARLFFGSRE
ncbi:MAG TPA: bifunctional riboflavin kinase/FAD synthetase [Cyanobacteria bacterium UBA11159]|nr:bifunctional riboflavin kinase/FAD synthetase [Cyanobacteria bacterium UBA11166]HBR72173.1 bifunctional riboflavin kinase/FAD synthetase [Cyanobacteria bacterium UBA11159]HBS70954.1 bifunctional riboflavin kinase/FAD synthetase [Cyanobacteria bacterium UBA11153]HCA93193.1 bifunctional riboflavin kinase/FAD synthetase [Cyanobacteria bacterium UBA9226]